MSKVGNCVFLAPLDFYYEMSEIQVKVPKEQQNRSKIVLKIFISGENALPCLKKTCNTYYIILLTKTNILIVRNRGARRI